MGQERGWTILPDGTIAYPAAPDAQQHGQLVVSRYRTTRPRVALVHPAVWVALAAVLVALGCAGTAYYLASLRERDLLLALARLQGA